ncbi:hypothetical protein J6590_051290 [Homalodisca vitripennis]|nr:hypothetical protein J6590_051290 [Homalodisca vitripennis]
MPIAYHTRTTTDANRQVGSANTELKVISLLSPLLPGQFLSTGSQQSYDVLEASSPPSTRNVKRLVIFIREAMEKLSSLAER